MHATTNTLFLLYNEQHYLDEKSSCFELRSYAYIKPNKSHCKISRYSLACIVPWILLYIPRSWNMKHPCKWLILHRILTVCFTWLEVKYSSWQIQHHLWPSTQNLSILVLLVKTTHFQSLIVQPLQHFANSNLAWLKFSLWLLYIIFAPSLVSQNILLTATYVTIMLNSSHTCFAALVGVP